MPKSAEVVKSGGQIARAGVVAGTLDGLRRIARLVTRSVVRMPDKKQPVYDGSYQLGKCNPIHLSFYNWSYVFRRFEYACDFTGKGFAAWVKLILAFGFFVGILSAPIVLVWLIRCFVGATTSLAWTICLLVLATLCVLILGYVLYAAVAILRGKPVVVPKPEFEIRSPNKTDSPDVGYAETIDVEAAEAD